MTEYIFVTFINLILSIQPEDTLATVSLSFTEFLFSKIYLKLNATADRIIAPRL